MFWNKSQFKFLISSVSKTMFCSRPPISLEVILFILIITFEHEFDRVFFLNLCSQTDRLYSCKSQAKSLINFNSRTMFKTAYIFRVDCTTSLSLNMNSTVSYFRCMYPNTRLYLSLEQCSRTDVELNFLFALSLE